jgi:hypothetical protein
VIEQAGARDPRRARDVLEARTLEPALREFVLGRLQQTISRRNRDARE